MLLLFFSLFASQDAPAFGDRVENTFNLARCTSYFLDKPLFPAKQQSEGTKHVITLYLPYTCWTTDCYTLEIDPAQTVPSECFVITNGYEGKQLFFNALQTGQLEQWDKIEKQDLPQASFYGYQDTSSQTYALIGSYPELSPHPLDGSKFAMCGVGAVYAREKTRAVQDEEARQHWQCQLGKGSVVVVYPSGGHHASTKF